MIISCFPGYLWNFKDFVFVNISSYNIKQEALSWQPQHMQYGARGAGPGVSHGDVVWEVQGFHVVTYVWWVEQVQGSHMVTYAWWVGQVQGVSHGDVVWQVHMITSGPGVSHGDVCVVGGAGPGVSHGDVCVVGGAGPGVSHGDVCVVGGAGPGGLTW